MKRRKDGERILFNGKPATVHLLPSGGGLQMVSFDHFDNDHHRMMFAQFVPWQELAQAPGLEASNA